MPNNPISIRLDEVHQALLDAIIDEIQKDGHQVSKTEIIQRALYFFAYDAVLGSDCVGEILDKHYRGGVEVNSIPTIYFPEVNDSLI